MDWLSGNNKVYVLNVWLPSVFFFVFHLIFSKTFSPVSFQKLDSGSPKRGLFRVLGPGVAPSTLRYSCIGCFLRPRVCSKTNPLWADPKDDTRGLRGPPVVRVRVKLSPSPSLHVSRFGPRRCCPDKSTPTPTPLLPYFVVHLTFCESDRRGRCVTGVVQWIRETLRIGLYPYFVKRTEKVYQAYLLHIPFVRYLILH